MAHNAFDEMNGRRLHLIRPQYIRADRPIGDSFGNLETEASAAAIIRYCQHMDGWKSFTRGEIEQFMGGPFLVNDLAQEIRATRKNGLQVLIHPYIYEAGGRFYVTHEFICRCFAGAPVEEYLIVKSKAA